MELKIIEGGKIIKYNGIRLQIVEAVDKCRGCYFKRLASCHPEEVGVCFPPWRPEAIIFRKYDKNRKENLHGRNNKSKHIHNR